MKLSNIFALTLGLFAMVEPVLAVKGVRKYRMLGDYDDDDDDYYNSKDKSKDKSKDGGSDDVEVVGCFSEETTVQVQGLDNPVSMKELQVGDYVLTNEQSYQPVYAFGHRNPSKEVTFYQLYTTLSTKPLEMTGEHLVFVGDKSNPVRADSIQVGDTLQGNKATEVIKIRQIQRKGVYTPLTNDGTVVADGIHASSYISLQKGTDMVRLGGMEAPMSQHDFVHLALSPFRMMCQGISSSLCHTESNDGIPSYIAYGIGIVDWGQVHLPVTLQVLFLGVALVALGTVALVEHILGAKLAPWIVLAIGAGYTIMKGTGVSVRATKPKKA